MKIHLIPDENLDKELYERVMSLLQAIPGVNKIFANGEGVIWIPDDMMEDQEVPDRDLFETVFASYSLVDIEMKSEKIRKWSFPHKRKTVSLKNLFKEIKEYREINGIPIDQFTILLTPTANKNNWFAFLDEKNPYNGFIHTDEWEHYIACDPAIPIAFEVIALALQKYIFKSYDDVMQNAHQRTIGCVSDLCLKKNDIILKMRTADICPDCMQKIQGELSMPEIHHALALMESFRAKMLYAQNFRQNSPPSRLSIRRGGRIYLTDYSNIEIRMPSMEKALYLLFLQHPEGLYLTELSDHREELYTIYSGISTRGLQEDMNRRIDEMTNVLREQLSVKISRIKRAFTDAIGASLAEHYIIQGENAEKKGIKLDRSLVDEK